VPLVFIQVIRVNRGLAGSVKPAMNPTGARAEDLCAKLLSAAGLRVIERNWRCRLGEIDLIAEEEGTLVFAEVRMRARGGFGGAGESLTAAKRSRLIAAARLYLTGRPQAPCRFDVFLLDGAPASVQWIRNAFGE
jgi:putative endonuclease